MTSFTNTLQQFCADIETGAKGMSVPTLCRIAKTLRLSTDYILYGITERENPDAVIQIRVFRIW